MTTEPHRYTSAVLSEHAMMEMARRGISEAQVRSVLQEPPREFQVRAGRVVLSALVSVRDRAYVLRVFVDVDREPPVVVTAYRSSKIGKYWSEP